jgi:Mce-associated membrane protein
MAAGLALLLLAAVLVHVLRPGLAQADQQAAVSSARTSLETLLSYSADEFDEHIAQVTPRLTSPFREEFAKVAASDIKPLAVDNEATVRAKVYDAGVMDVAGDGSTGSTVRVMAFVNQATSTTKQPQPAIDQNRVIATMTKVGDRWLISALDAY